MTSWSIHDDMLSAFVSSRRPEKVTGGSAERDSFKYVNSKYDHIMHSCIILYYQLVTYIVVASSVVLLLWS